MNNIFKSDGKKVDLLKIGVFFFLFFLAFYNVYYLNSSYIIFLGPFVIIWMFEGMNVSVPQPTGPTGSQYFYVILVVLYFILSFVLLVFTYIKCYKLFSNKIAKIIFILIGIVMLVVIYTRIPLYEGALKEVFKVLK